MSFDFIRRYYGISARRGDRVRYTGGRSPQEGTIRSAPGSYLSILLDGAKVPGLFHPTWEIEYLPPTPAKTIWDTPSPLQDAPE